MKFYLVDDLECGLTVLILMLRSSRLCNKESEYSRTSIKEGEAGELGSGGGSVMSTSARGADHPSGEVSTRTKGARYWGTGEGKLELSSP